MTRPTTPFLPDSVAAAVRSRWPGIGDQWCDQVEAEFADLCGRYQATPVAVMRSRYGLVVDVVADGQPLIFRASPDPAGADQGMVRLALADLDVGPQVHEFFKTPTGTWSVLERVLPGTPLGDLDMKPIQIDAVCEALRPLVDQPPPSPGMPTLVSWLEERLSDDELTDLAPGRQPAPYPQRQQALAILHDLADTASDALCHGDASPWNLLLGDRGRIKLIDPRGLSGEVAYDFAVVALKASEHIPPHVSVSLFASRVGVDPQRALAWIEVAEAARV